MPEWLLPALVIGVSVTLSWPLGIFMRWAMHPQAPGRRRLAYEARISSLLGRRASSGQDWKAYCLSMLAFNLLMFLVAFLILIGQHLLPFNPDGKAGLESSLAFHTAASFTSNTNLQHYAGEVTLSYFSQIFALMWLQFLSAATGIAAVTALRADWPEKRNWAISTRMCCGPRG